jgi:hypothetical protein
LQILPRHANLPVPISGLPEMKNFECVAGGLVLCVGVVNDRVEQSACDLPQGELDHVNFKILKALKIGSKTDPGQKFQT